MDFSTTLLYGLICGNYYKKNHRPSDFCTKPLFCGHHQNLNPILT
ncbi:hypothetical protein LEP1GSC021_2295 [Leptospira noguchii str. 1993005606]|nr:hypothetical protein LEP1GSC021_2295 [Leptospira noguchii str. 1993005606]